MERRYAVRVLLLDERDRVLLFRARRPETGRAFWFPAGGGLEEGEDVHAAAVRELAEETGLRDVPLGPEVWRRRHVFTWRGVEYDQRERWFLARVAHFEPDRRPLVERPRAGSLPGRSCPARSRRAPAHAAGRRTAREPDRGRGLN